MELVTTIISGLVGAFTGLLAAYVKNRIDYQHEIRSDLWNKRYNAYTKIWKMTQAIPRWPKNDSLTYQQLVDLSVGFQEWYFNDGGILLSESGREKYGTMQEGITNILNHQKTERSSPVNEPDYNSALASCSQFRTAITSELLSRKISR
jgi:hypothetical protein